MRSEKRKKEKKGKERRRNKGTRVYTDDSKDSDAKIGYSSTEFLAGSFIDFNSSITLSNY